jgi:molybdenum cofactor cytidylyltransferase
VTPTSPRDGVVAVVLAAGAGSRFAPDPSERALADKLLVHVDGVPLVLHALTAAHGAGIHRVRLVAPGADAATVGEALARALPPGVLDGVEVVANPQRDRGMATSLAAGLAGLSDDATCSAVVVLLADEARVDAAAVRAVLDAVDGGAPAARVRYADGTGHPVALARHVLPALAALSGDVGAREVLATIGTVEVPIDGPRPVDVDRPEDLGRLHGAGPGGTST